MGLCKRSLPAAVCSPKMRSRTQFVGRLLSRDAMDFQCRKPRREGIWMENGQILTNSRPGAKKCPPFFGDTELLGVPRINSLPSLPQCHTTISFLQTWSISNRKVHFHGANALGRN